MWPSGFTEEGVHALHLTVFSHVVSLCPVCILLHIRISFSVPSSRWAPVEAPPWIIINEGAVTVRLKACACSEEGVSGADYEK